jgi:LEA14-like dessication related protein
MAALLLALAGCQSVDQMLKSAPKPTARITGARLQDLNLEKAGLVFDVEVKNPYAVPLPLLDVSYAFGTGGQRLAEGSAKSSGSIPASGARTLQVPVVLQFRSLFAAAKEVQPGSVLPYTADLRFGLDAPVLGRVDVPVSHAGELPVPALPQVSLIAFDVSALSLDRVSATARVRLTNNNQFDLDLNRLVLDLALGGKEVAHSSAATGAKLARGQSATIDVPVSFSPQAFGTGMFNLLRGSEAGYAVSGWVETRTRFGPLTLPIKAGGRTPVSR